jgi:hypothetical protein
MGCAENILRAGNIYPLNFENPLTRNAFILAPLAIITFQVRKAPILILIVAEKSYEKIPSQYERHERQHKQRPITIAVYFWRGFATHEEKAKDTIAPRVHGSSIGGGPLMVLNTPSDIKKLNYACCVV